MASSGSKLIASYVPLSRHTSTESLKIWRVLTSTILPNYQIIDTKSKNISFTIKLIITSSLTAICLANSIALSE